MRTVVVTGGNRGIGLALVEALARQGFRVVALVRDPSRMPPVPGVDVVAGDLSSARTVADAADALRDACPAIDVLVHNAGLWPTRLAHNEDGLEQAFAVNHLAPFQLNLALEDRLAKVVQVSAGLYVKGRVELDRTPTGVDFHRMRTYCDTKLANLLMVPLFARRWQDAGMTINAVHPGVIRTRLGDPGGVTGLVLRALERARTPRGGVRAVVVAYLRFVAEHPGRARFIHASAYASYLPAHAEVIAAAKAPRLELMLAWLAPHVRAGSIVDLPDPLLEMLLIGPVAELSRRWLAGAADIDLDRAARVLPDRIWASLRG